uniref:Uncharacterized protein n=1 Tax=Oryza glumipatula TaxID=40148 RepID=A0A0D9YGS5_9ORYZ
MDNSTWTVTSCHRPQTTVVPGWQDHPRRMAATRRGLRGRAVASMVRMGMTRIGWSVAACLHVGVDGKSEIQGMMKEARDMKLKKANRDCNGISHILANKARCKSLTNFWPDGSCNFISHLVCYG